jgi:hypothetical protein
MLEQSHRELLQSLVRYPDITSVDITDFKDDASVNIHTYEGADEEEVLFLVGEIFPDIDFGEGEVLFDDEVNGEQTIVYTSESADNEYGVEINIYFKRDYQVQEFDEAI